MRKTMHTEDITIYSADEMYSVRVEDLDKQLEKLLWLFAIVMLVVGVLSIIPDKVEENPQYQYRTEVTNN